MNILPYLFILAAFLLAVFLLQKFSRTFLTKNYAEVKKNDPLQPLALSLGLNYEALPAAGGSKSLASSGSRVWGVYNGVPVEMLYTTETKLGTGMPLYSYTVDKIITLQVKNSGKKQFDIMPKNLSAVGGTPTGNSNFDTNLMLIGDHSLSPEFIDYCGQIGWMHLSLNGTALTFHDTFYNQFKGISGGRQMVHAVHPIWGTSATQMQIDTQHAKNFFDILTSLAKKNII